MNRALLRLSPQRVDPLSWYSRSAIPSGLAVIGALFGLASVAAAWPAITTPWLDLLALVVVTLSCVFIQARSRSLRRAFSSLDAGIALAIAAAGGAASVVANLDSSLGVQYWWAPSSVALVIAALAPYSSIVQLTVYSAAMVLVTVGMTVVRIAYGHSDWPVVSTLVIGSVSVVVAFAAATTFVSLVVGRTLAMVSADEGRADDATERQEALALVERHTVARLGARVSPFLERIADSGTVTDEDRALAGQLALRLRSDLLERTDRNWLESLTDVGRIFVVDPEHRAERFNTAQRTALRGLVSTVLATPGTNAGSLFLEVRGRDDGTTAVALSFDVELPEGRRSLLVAPFYIALQSTVDDLRWDRGRGVVTFEVR